MKKIFLIACSFLSISLFAQDKEDKMMWNEGVKLQWEDFQAEAPQTHPFHANTSSGMSYSFSYANGPTGIENFNYEVFSTFNPEKSWVKEGKESAHLLAHEQLHFDISELHARILKEKLDKYKLSKNPKSDLKRMYEDTMKMRTKMQELFDKETNHSMNAEASQRWQEFVESELKKYSKYSS